MSNLFRAKNGLHLTPVDLTTLTSPQAGDLACDINDSNKIKRYDANALAWVEVGSGGGVGGVDILFVQDFESATLSSFTQVGLVLSQTDPLHGKFSAVLTHQTGTSPANDQYFKQILSVDRKFRGQAMVLTLDSKSSASQGNLVINIKDETNNANLVASEQLQLSNDVNGKKTSVAFTIPESCASLSYTITALPESGSPISRIDDIICELAETALLETAVEVPVVTAWQGYTPTFQGFGTPSNIEFEYRQVGENVEIRGKFVSGTSTAVEARVGLPGGLTSAGTGLIPSIQIVGKGNNGGPSNTTFFSGLVTLVEPSVTYLTIGAESSTSAGLTKQNANSIAGSGTILSFFASVPCAGLSATSTKTIALTQSGLVQNSDSYLYAAGNAGQTITANVTDIPFIAVSNVGSDIQWNGASFTVINSGVFDISGQIRFAATAADRTVALYINGIQASRLNVRQGVTGDFVPFSTSRFFNKNDIVSLRTSPGGTLINAPTDHFITISHQGSLKQVSVSSDQKITIPTSELRFEGSSSRGSTATAIVRFDSVAKLRGDAFTVTSDAVNGTAITMKKAGKLDVSSSIVVNGIAYISINQAVLSAVPASASEIITSESNTTTGLAASLAGSVFVKVGDIIRVSASAAPGPSIVNSLNLSFQEQDIAVSVTNTLPQFSESDSSVRVDTANGYGSTASNKIRRFSNVRDNIGTDIEYVDDSANGARFVVKSSGIYHISYSDNATSVTSMGISKNASSLTTGIASLSSSEILAIGVASDSGSGRTDNVAWQGYLTAGDIVRPHTDGTAAGFNATVNFTISKVGKPNVTGVNVTPFVNVPQPDVEAIEVANSTSTFGSTNTGVPVLSITKNTNKGIIAVDSSSANGTSFRALKKCDFKISASGGVTSAAGSLYITRNATILTATSPNNILNVQSITGIPSDCNLGTVVALDVGDVIRVQRDTTNVTAVSRVMITATAASDSILTPSETFSTDTASLTYAPSSAYTLSTLQNAPVGTFITFTYAANTNTRTQTTTAPTQTTADMNTNGILIYTRAYNAASTSGNPSAIAIQIGKGLKGVSQNLYKAVGKVTAGNLDHFIFGNFSSGARLKEYNEITGILVVDAGFVNPFVTSGAIFSFSDTSEATSGYLVINAAKTPALTGVPLLQPRIATLSDVKASGTAGGTATSGSYQTRTLNTLSDPSGIVTSLASNQFTLPAGEYYIEAFAPTYGTGINKFKIRNVTDSIDSIIGPSNYAALSASGDRSSSSGDLKGTLVISSSKIFELQHRVSSTKATDGYGLAATFGDNEVYSILKITRVR